MYIKDVASGRNLTENLNGSNFSGANLDRSNNGIFYSRAEPENKLESVNSEHQKLYHQVGRLKTRQAHL